MSLLLVSNSNKFVSNATAMFYSSISLFLTDGELIFIRNFRFLTFDYSRLNLLFFAFSLDRNFHLSRIWAKIVTLLVLELEEPSIKWYCWNPTRKTRLVIMSVGGERSKSNITSAMIFMLDSAQLNKSDWCKDAVSIVPRSCLGASLTSCVTS